MKKVKDWIREKEYSEPLFSIVIQNEDGIITSVCSIDGSFFSLGEYQVLNSEEIFEITGFNKNLRTVGFKRFKPKLSITSITSSSLGGSMGMCAITDISLIDSDTIELGGFLLETDLRMKEIVNTSFLNIN